MVRDGGAPTPAMRRMRIPLPIRGAVRAGAGCFSRRERPRAAVCGTRHFTRVPNRILGQDRTAGQQALLPVPAIPRARANTSPASYGRPRTQHGHESDHEYAEVAYSAAFPDANCRRAQASNRRVHWETLAGRRKRSVGCASRGTAGPWSPCQPIPGPTSTKVLGVSAGVNPTATPACVASQAADPDRGTGQWTSGDNVEAGDGSRPAAARCVAGPRARRHLGQAWPGCTGGRCGRAHGPERRGLASGHSRWT